jgi:D-serine deaminase-like pyridoxal phosphate-dependent protein
MTISTKPQTADVQDLRGPDAIGARIEQLATPVLVLDLERFESNCRVIGGFLAERGVAWRPHAKGHRSPEIARRQMAFGAMGVTVSKVSEAEVMAAAGIPSVLVTTHQPTLPRWQRIARSQRLAEVLAPVDHPAQVELARQAAASEHATIPVVVDVNIGMNRSGAAPGTDALALAQLVASTPGLRLAGVIGYEGHLLRQWPVEDKEAAIREAIGALTSTADLLRANGLPVDLVSAGGTGSYTITATLPGVTEIQAGGGCFYDLLYADDCHVDGLDFALTVRTTVASRPAPDTATIDAGWKALPNERVAPRPIEPAGLTLRSLSAEHGVVVLGEGAPDLAIGDQVVFVPGYHDVTVFRHEAIYGARKGVVEAAFEVTARGIYS